MDEDTKKLEERVARIADSVSKRALEIITAETATMEEKLKTVKKLMVESVGELRAMTILDLDNLVFAKTFEVGTYGKVDVNRSYDTINITADGKPGDVHHQLPVPRDMAISVKVIITELGTIEEKP